MYNGVSLHFQPLSKVKTELCNELEKQTYFCIMNCEIPCQLHFKPNFTIQAIT